MGPLVQHAIRQVRSTFPWRRGKTTRGASRFSQAPGALRTARGPRGTVLRGNLGQYLADPTAFMIHMPRVRAGGLGTAVSHPLLYGRAIPALPTPSR
jgi:hypothetical protein